MIRLITKSLIWFLAGLLGFAAGSVAVFVGCFPQALTLALLAALTIFVFGDFK